MAFSKTDLQVLGGALERILSPLINITGLSKLFEGLYTQTTEAMTLYVDGATGGDNNPGTITAPFKTIQAAVDSLPKYISHAVTIMIASGNYAGFMVGGFVGRPSPTASQAAYLNFVGTQIPATLATGLTTGTLTAFANGTAPTFSVFTDSTATWTVNDLRGKFLYISAGTGAGVPPPLRQYVITSNTATAITVAGVVTAAAAGATYQILDNGTVINSTTPQESVNPTTGSVNYFGSSIYVVNNTIGGPNGFALLFTKMTLSGSGANCEGAAGFTHWKWMRFVAASNGIVAGNSRVNVSQSYFSTTLNGISQANVNSQSAGMTADGCFFNAGQRGLSVSALNGTTSGSYFLNQTVAGIAVATGSAGLFTITGCRIDTTVIGISAVASTSTALAGLVVATTDISGCTAAGVRLAGPLAFAQIGVVTGTSNGIGLDISRGAKASVAATATLTGTIEVSVDGATTTLAAMRALSPKAFPAVASPYGTAFFE